MSEFRIPTMKKRVTLTNLAIDGSFEDALNNWNCWLAEPTDTSQAKDGSHSLKLGGDALAASKSAFLLVEGHKYYGREYLKTAGELTAADCRFEFCGAVDGVEKAFVFGWNRGNYPDWTAISGIITVDGSYSDGFGLRTFTVAGSCNAWVDCITVIDLTEACGAGNEPSKEWCDANIPYFTGSYEVDIPVSTPIQKLVTGLTIPVPQVVVPETTETDLSYTVNHDGNFGMLLQNTKIIEGDNYLVVVDGVQYACTAYYNAEDDVTELGGIKDVPFYISHYMSIEGSLYVSFNMQVYYPDSETHTIEINKMVDKSVTQITDASGRVIWKQKPSTVTVTITADGDVDYAWLEIDGGEYYENQTLELPMGTVIRCYVHALDYSACYIYLNNEEIARAQGTGVGASTSYDYTVTKNCTISLEDESNHGSINITEE